MVTVHLTQQGPVHLQKTHLAPNIKKQNFQPSKDGPGQTRSIGPGVALVTPTDDLQLQTTVDANHNHSHPSQLLLFP